MNLLLAETEIKLNLLDYDTRTLKCLKRSKAEILELLSNEIKLLEDSTDLSLGELIEFLFQNFPPKHKQKSKKPEMRNPGERKRAYYILCSLYHPDKVDASHHGQKYKVLCEEISKRINQRFGDI